MLLHGFTRCVSVCPAECYGVPFTFSTHLLDVESNRREQNPPLVLGEMNWKSTENSFSLEIKWRLDESLIGMCSPFCRHKHLVLTSLEININPYQSQMSIVQVQLSVRGFGGLLDAWDFIAAMPIPTPPTWWRYNTRQEGNQAIIDDLPPLTFGSEMIHVSLY